MQEKIIDFLKRKQGYISGDQIAKTLGITRQGLWKHIQGLKESGYDIEAVPHLGYKLLSSPDRLFPQEVSSLLNTKFIAKNIHYFDSISSTMDIAWELGMKGYPEGALVLAESQAKGRGRLGREWMSPKYKGIYLSLILRPKVSANQSSIFTLLSAASVCEAIKDVTGLDAQIKWPNDILLRNKKLGGILTELNADMDQVRFIVIGIGINVNNDKKALVKGAASLSEEKKEDISRIQLLKELLRRIEMNYLLFQDKGAEAIIDKWRNFNITLGKRVKVISQKEQIEGEALDIDSDGGLLLRLDSGLSKKIMCGDIAHCR